MIFLKLFHAINKCLYRLQGKSIVARCTESAD